MIKDYFLFIPILILTIIMGYFLGLIISSTVDYRLKDIVVNLPRPKTNVFLNDKIVDQSKQKKKIIKKNDITDTHIAFQKKNINNKSSKTILNKEKSIDEIQEKVESFTSTINKLTNKIKSKANYTHVFEDKNIQAYSELFTNSNELYKDDNIKFNLKPFNAEESNQIYTTYTK